MTVPCWMLTVLALLATLLCCVAARMFAGRYRWLAIAISIISGILAMPLVIAVFAVFFPNAYFSGDLPMEVWVLLGWFLSLAMSLLFVKALFTVR